MLEYKYIKKANVRCEFFWGGCFSSVGYSLLLHKSKSITVQPDRVTIGEGMSFGCILMRDFFKALAERVERNTTSFENYERMYVPLGTLLKEKEGEPIKTRTLFKHIQVSTIITCTKKTVGKRKDVVKTQHLRFSAALIANPFLWEKNYCGAK